MTCFHPREGFRPPDGGRLVFHDRGDCVGAVAVKCGQCIGCRLDRQAELAVRAMHEVQMAESVGRLSWFPTLTCDDAHLSALLVDPKRELQLFHKRVRNNLGAFRYLSRFEYSPEAMRPHFHSILFGLELPDVRRASVHGSRFPAFRSDALNACWPFGHIDLRLASHDAAMYVAKHHVDKLTGEAAQRRYQLIGDDGAPLVDFATGELVSLPPEFLTMSRRPGLGRAWIERFWQSVYRTGDAGGSVVGKGGRRLKLPAYYDRVLADRLEVDMDGVKFARQEAATTPARLADSTPRRLAVREQCARARLALKRSR